VSIGPDFGALGGGLTADGVIARRGIDVAVSLDVISGSEPGELYTAPAPVRPFPEVDAPGPLTVGLATTAPHGVPVDEQPRRAAERTADLLADLGHDVREQAPNWDDETFPESWAIYAGGAAQHVFRVVERLHGRPADVAKLEPATRAWLVDGTPISLIDYLEAGERL